MRSPAHPCRLIGLVLLLMLLAGVAHAAGVRSGARLSTGAVGLNVSHKDRSAAAFVLLARKPVGDWEHSAHLDFLSTSKRHAASQHLKPQSLKRPPGRIASSPSLPTVAARRFHALLLHGARRNLLRNAIHPRAPAPHYPASLPAAFRA